MAFVIIETLVPKNATPRRGTIDSKRPLPLPRKPYSVPGAGPVVRAARAFLEPGGTLGMRREPPAKPVEALVDCEAALLECAAGREAAAAIIYRSEVPRLRAVVHRIVRSREHADDVIHDAFVQILRDARSFDPQRGSARAWIYTIVRNTALKSRRAARREVSIEDEALHAMRDLQALAEPEIRTADYADLKNCLDTLEPQRRASLILAIVDGRTHAEIATYLGVPIGTVKSWIRRELVALREQLK